ncbi:MAG: phage tail tape measure protein [Desulfobacterales bacterium]|nr:phage tail tape measure protein [Desulfobacterales bacterium]
METIFKLGILLSVVDRISGPSQQIGRNMDGLKGKVLGLAPAFDKFKSYGLVVFTVAAGIMNLLSGTAMATVPTQKALGELSSVGIENLAALEKAGQDFSGQWSGTTKAQFIGAAYDIKSGISSLSDEGVAEFTKLAALTGKATKSTTAEMTGLFATGYGIYKGMYADLTDMEFGQVFSAGIAASVKSFKTTGSGMAQAISQLGAAATTAKVPLQEQLSILGMLQATMTGSEAGTKYKAMMQSAAGAGEKLNLEFMDANNQLLSMPDILKTLQGKYGSTLDAVEKMEIQKAFGTQEAVAVIDLLYNKVGDLESNITGLSSAMDQGTSFTEIMANTMNQDIGAGVALLSQRFQNLVERIGNQLIPVMVPLFTTIGNIINRMTDWTGENETATRILVLFIAGVAATALVLGGLAAVFGSVGLLMPNVAAGFTMTSKALVLLKTRLFTGIAATKSWILWQRQAFLTSLYFHGGILGLAKSLAVTFLTSIKVAIVSVLSFTKALLANPVTWVVVGIVALGAALYFLYQKFDWVRAGVDKVLYVLGYFLGVVIRTGRGILDAVTHPMQFVQWIFYEAGRAINALTSRFNSLSPAIQSIAKLMLSLVFPPLAVVFNWEKLKTGVTTMISWVKSKIPEFLESGKALYGALSDGIKSKAMMPVDAVKTGLSKVRNLLPFSDAKEGPLSTLTLSGRRLIETIGAGISSAGPGLAATVSGVMAAVASLTPLGHGVNLPAVQQSSPGVEQKTVSSPGRSISTVSKKSVSNSSTQVLNSTRESRKKEIHIHINGLALPGVKDAESFVAQLQKIAEGHDV